MRFLNTEAVTKTITTLQELGHLEDVDEALVTACLSLAGAVDGNPDNASLWHQYLKAIASLNAITTTDEDTLIELFAALRNTTNEDT